jgi:protein SCO1
VLFFLPFRRLTRRFALLFVGVFALLGCTSDSERRFHSMDITGADYGQGFELPDVEGVTRTLADFRGSVVLVYFGFIQCPDVCPTALHRAVSAKNALGADGERFTVVFITLDPERDRSEVVRAYLGAFDPGFVGLIPDMASLPEVAKAFRVYYRKVPTGDSYTLDHTATSFLYDTQGQLRLAVPHAMDVAGLAADVRVLLQEPH